MKSQVEYRGLTIYWREDWLEREMGYAAIPTKNRMRANPEVLVFGIQLELAALHKMAVELTLSFDGVAISNSTDTAAAASAGASARNGSRLASLQRLLARHTAVDTVATAADAAVTGSMKGTAAAVTPLDWSTISVSNALPPNNSV